MKSMSVNFPSRGKAFSRGIYSSHDFLSTVRDGSCPTAQWEVCCEVPLNNLSPTVFNAHLITSITFPFRSLYCNFGCCPIGADVPNRWNGEQVTL